MIHSTQSKFPTKGAGVLRKVFVLFQVFLFTCGFTCSPEGKKQSGLNSVTSEKASTQPQTTGAVTGILRFRVLIGSGAGLVDKLGRENATVRIWDWEHEKTPRTSKVETIDELLNHRNDVGDFTHQPEVYVEISGVTCSPEQDIDFVCSQLILKTNAEFDEKVHNDPEFREKLGRMLGSSITVDRSNAVFNISDVK